MPSRGKSSRHQVRALVIALVATCAAVACAPRAPLPSTARDSTGTGGLGSQVETFEHAWKRIGETYPYADMKGLDWQAVHDELLPRARKARTREELRPVLQDLLSRLGESHFVLIPAGAGAPAATPPAPGSTSAGGARPSDTAQDASEGGGWLGLDVRAVDDGALVVRVAPGGPAARAGIRPGWIVDSVGGIEVGRRLSELRRSLEDPHVARVQGYVLATSVLAGSVGSTVTLELRHGGGGRSTVELVRAAPPGEVSRLGNLPPMSVELEHRVEGGNVGYVRFNVFLVPIAAPFADAVESFAAAKVDGIVVDLRGNPGGIGAMVMGLAGHFVGEPDVVLGTMTTRQGELRFVVSPRPAAKIHRGPLAILVDEASMSTAELFAAGLAETGRARVFGTRTAGMALPSVVESLPNGDRMQFVLADLRGPGGMRIEGAGVEPHVAAAPERAALLEGRDPALDAALAWIEGHAGDAE